MNLKNIKQECDSLSSVDEENMEYWHKLCCLGEVGWDWDSVDHIAPWKDKDGKRVRFQDIDEAVKAEKNYVT